ncbi:uncharacterized protein [Littorina saxatilis]|uniref:uncharacterized protein isoform X2 n=1 Tax=Littorina saxatilis TaxID=31220 RepID=UPI0038B4BDE1
MEEGDTAFWSDIKIEIDVAEETPQCWDMTEPQLYVPDREVVAKENTAAMSEVQTLKELTTISTHRGVRLKQEIESSETQTAVNTHRAMADDDDGSSHGSTPGNRRKQTPGENKPPKKARKPAAQSCREWRERLKDVREAYEIHKEMENLRIKAYKLSMSEEKRSQYREKNRLRIQKLRAKQNAEGKVKATVSRVLTRKEKENRQEVWRQQKQKQHAKESKSQKDARNARRRDLYAMRNQALEEERARRDITFVVENDVKHQIKKERKEERAAVAEKKLASAQKKLLSDKVSTVETPAYQNYA